MNQEKNRFRVNFKGILDILSKHLYSSEEVFLRELLQNSKDAITLRQLKDLAFSTLGKVSIEVIPADDKSVLIFEDNGNGLTLPEVESFLSVIGSSSKKDLSDLQMGSQSFVGQFGIGLLSCFMVSDKITLITKSTASEKAVKWEASIQGTYAARELEESSMDTGTKVFLELNHEKKDVYTADKVKRLLTKYSQFLGMDVRFINNGTTEAIEQKGFPWDAENVTNEEILEFGRSYFQIDFNHYIPLKSEDGTTKGIGFIFPFSSKPGSQQAHHVYIKNMLIDETCGDILPEWAFFTKAIVNSETLRPTASREGIYKDRVLEITRNDFEESIRDYFARLATSAPSILEHIINSHQLAIKAFAISDNAFFDLIADFLTFPTSQGHTSVRDLKKEEDGIKYVEDLDHFRQILPIAKANNQLVVNTGYIYDTTLMKKLENKYPHLFSSLDDLRFTSILEEPTWDEDNEFSAFRDRCNDVLSQFSCEAVLRKFSPETLPAIFHLTTDQAFSRDMDRTKNIADDLWGGMLSELSISTNKYNKSSTLYLNLTSLLVRKISKIKSNDQFRQCIELIYVNSLLLGHYALNEQESSLLNENLISIIDLIL